MPYKRSYKSRPKRVMRKRTYRKKSSVASLAKSVSRIKRTLRQKSPAILLTRSVNNTSVSSPLVTYGLDQYNSMTPVFGTSADDLECNRVIDKSDTMDITVRLQNEGGVLLSEDATINFTCYLVQLKDATAGNQYTGAGSLNITNVSDYVSAPNPGAHALLNLKYFKILKSKKFTLTNNEQLLGQSTAQTQYGSDIRWTWKINQPRLIQNPTGNFNARPPVDPSKARFILFFNDNSNIDLEAPTIMVNHIKSLRQIA